ncbi:MAG: excinuclease ABC subunit UvrC [Balneolaceae bacterium]
MSLSINEKVEHLPDNPGVYQFIDAGKNTLYVGKAKNLRKRVRSYFQGSRNHDGRIRVMISKIKDMEVIVTDSEAEALILENNLIKQLHPRYNIMYRDDKSYPYICMTNEERPRVFPTRTVIRDGSTYFGPYDHVGQMRRMLETIRRAFGFCTCAVSSKNIDKSRGIPKWHSCFDDYLNNCSGDWSIEEYKEAMEKVERMMAGKTEQLMRQVKEEMQIASDSLKFEEAARLRDSYESLYKYNQKMKIVDEKQVNRDLFAISADRDIKEACGVLFKIREGKLIGKFHRFIRNIDEVPEPVIIQSFMEDYYTGQFAGAIPDEVYSSHEPDDPDPLLEYLWQQRGKKVPMHTPKIGEKKHLIELAISNAKLLLEGRVIEKEKTERERIPQSVKDLKKYLNLSRLPRRIECFDNSNIQGSDPVASMVSFVDASPRKSEYKRFNIRNVDGADDFASMYEVVRRRYERVKKEGLQIPDLLLVDGGKGQLNAALKALKDIDMENDFDVAGLAKRLEEVFLPGKTDAVMIPKSSSSLKLLQKTRDEAHRFAITFHRKKRKQRTITSELVNIPGIGKKTSAKMLKHFGSVQKIKKAGLSELQSFSGEKKGRVIYEYFRKE